MVDMVTTMVTSLFQVAVECGKPVISVESTEVDSFIIQLFILLSLSFPSNRLK